MTSLSRRSATRKTGTGSRRAAAPRAAVRAPSAEAATAPAAELLSAIERMERLKSDLQQVRNKLSGLDRDALDDAGLAQRAAQLLAVGQAIAVARSASLDTISAAFEKELPALQAATATLAESLARLNRAVQVIEAVAGVLGVIERIVSLGGPN